MRNLFNRLNRGSKIVLIGLSLAASVLFGFKAAEDYFEVSKNLDIFATLYRELNIYYVDESKPGELVKTAIDAMLESLDPYTVYIPESDIEDYRFFSTGQYGGIGATVRNLDGKIIISEPYEESPAQKGGLKAGDVLVEVNGYNVQGKNSDEISHLLKGQAGSTVKLIVQRPGETRNLSFSFVREEIKVKNVPYYGMLNSQTGIIKLTGFTKDAAREVKEALLKLKNEKGCKNLILDLRSNPGGLLQEAVDIVNLFVEKGLEVSVTKGKLKEWDQVFKAVNNPVDLTIPLVVLVDPNSASASEVVSGALQDLDRAVIVGQRTFGKGLVQQNRQLTYNAQLKVTVAKYYIPSGRCVQAKDYSKRTEDGSVLTVPDSLITAFKTRNGRIVYDGAGIQPDIAAQAPSYSNILYTLLGKNYIFDFATQYVIKHPSLNSGAREFKISDADYNDFMQFLKGKDISYETKTEESLEEFRNTVVSEKYFEDLKTEFESLKKKVQDRKKDDLIKFKEEISQFIGEEIVSRYFYQTGRLEYSIKFDNEMMEASKVFEDNKHKEILTKIIPATKPFNTNKKF